RRLGRPAHGDVRRRRCGRPGIRARRAAAVVARESSSHARAGCVGSARVDTPREFFETLETRVDPAKAAGLTATYLFEIDGAGIWTVDVDDGKVSVSENGGDADCTISASSETFMKIARGEQNPTAAYMSGKLKVKGDMGQANDGETWVQARRWVAALLGDERLGFLAALPLDLTLELDGLGYVRFCHGAPGSDELTITKLTPDERLRGLLAEVDERVLICGHTHVQFDRAVDGIRVVNAGSVGFPYE